MENITEEKRITSLDWDMLRLELDGLNDMMREIRQSLDLLHEEVKSISRNPLGKKATERKMLTTMQAAEFLCMSRRTVQELGRVGKIASFKPKNGKGRYYRLEDLEEYQRGTKTESHRHVEQEALRRIGIGGRCT